MRIKPASVVVTAVCCVVAIASASGDEQKQAEARLLVAPVAALENVGDDALVYLPGGRAVVAGNAGIVSNAQGPIEPWMVEQALTSTVRSALNSTKNVRPVPVIVGMAPGTDLEAVAVTLGVGETEIRWVDDSAPVPQIGLLVAADTRRDFLIALESLDGSVVFADVQSGAKLKNARSAWRCQSGVSGETPIFDHGLYGQGQIIGVMDTGIDPGSCFFADEDRGLPALNGDDGTAIDLEQRKVLAVDFWWDQDWPSPGVFDWDSQGHGTHTAGIAGGDHDGPGSYEANDGMAPAARLVIQDGGFEVDPCGDLPGLECPMRPLGPMLEQAWLQGARIHSNSWGDEEDSWPLNRYTERTADIDRFVWEHPEMLVLAAAGNAGAWGLDTVISPSTGKNVVSVGATSVAINDPVCRAGFSSFGWAHDGRIKPDVLAPGSSVVAASTDLRADTTLCTEIAKSGTSMAAPTAAGLAALVRQYFEEGWHVEGLANPDAGFEPSAALLKATLIASAVDLHANGCSTVGPIPSREQGWGLIQLDRALFFEGDERRLTVVDRGEAFEVAGESDELLFRGLEGGPLKVVLVWTDPPSTSLAETNIINDLDLEVRGPDGSLWLGNVFDNGVSVEGGSADRLNTVEVVWLPEAPSGTWTVTVWSHVVSVSPQGYALAIVRPLEEPGARDAREAGRAAP